MDKLKKYMGMNFQESFNFSEISKGFNINSYKIDDPSQIQPILKKCLNSDKPNLIDIQIDGSV